MSYDSSGVIEGLQHGCKRTYQTCFSFVIVEAQDSFERTYIAG